MPTNVRYLCMVVIDNISDILCQFNHSERLYYYLLLAVLIINQ